MVWPAALTHSSEPARRVPRQRDQTVRPSSRLFTVNTVRFSRRLGLSERGSRRSWLGRLRSAEMGPAGRVNEPTRELSSVATRMLAVTCFKWNTRRQVHGQNGRNRVRSRVAEPPRSTDPATPIVRRHDRHRQPVRRTGSSPPFRSVDLAVEPLPVGLPQHKLLQLAGGGAGELLPELDLLGALVAGQRGPAVGDPDLLDRKSTRLNSSHLG